MALILKKVILAVREVGMHRLKPSLARNDESESLSADGEKAKNELTPGLNQELREFGVVPALPTNLMHGAPGHQVAETLGDDEDGEGRSATERLAEFGSKAAERDKVNQAGRTHARGL